MEADGGMSSARWWKVIVDGCSGAEVRCWSSSRSSSEGVDGSRSRANSHVSVAVVCESSSCPSARLDEEALKMKCPDERIKFNHVGAVNQ